MAQPKLENSLLWKISGNGLAEESYLFGTNHSVHYSFLDSVSGFWDAFNSAKNIVGEITYTQDSKTKSNPFSTLSEKDFLLPKDSSYRVLYNEEDYNIVNDFIQANKLIPVPLDQAPIRPGFLVLLASYKLRNSLEDNDKQRETMDSWIIRAASLKNKNILQLDNNESYEEAVEKLFLFKAPLSEQTKLLLDFITSVH